MITEGDEVRSYLEMERKHLPLLRLGRERAIALVLRILEEGRLNYVGAHPTVDTRDAVTDLTNAAELLICWIYAQCRSKPGADIPRETKIQRYRITREAFSFAGTYYHIMNLFDLVQNGLATLSMDANILRFQALHPYRELFEIQRVDATTRWNPTMLELYPDTLWNFFPKITPKDEYRLKYTYSKDYRTNLARYIWRQLQQEWSTIGSDLLHYSTENFKQVWHFLMVHSVLHRSAYELHILLNKDYSKINSIILFFRKTKLITTIERRTGLDHEIIEAILADLIFDPTINQYLSHQPLIEIYGKYIILTPSLIIGNRIEANLLRLLARKYPQLYSDRIGGKKRKFDKEIQQLFAHYGFQVCGKKFQNKTTGLTITDIDALAWKDSVLFVIQAKDFIMPGTTTQLHKAEKQIEHAIVQLQTSLTYLDAQFEELLPELFPAFDRNRSDITVFPFTVTRFFTGSRAQPMAVPVVDYNYLQSILQKEGGDPVKVINHLNSFLDLDSFRARFKVGKRVLNVGPYKVIVPVYEKSESD